MKRQFYICFVHVIYGFFESYKNFYLFQSINKSFNEHEFVPEV